MIITCLFIFAISFTLVVMMIIMVNYKYIIYQFTEIDEFMQKDELLIKASRDANYVSRKKNKIFLVCKFGNSIILHFSNTFAH